MRSGTEFSHYLKIFPTYSSISGVEFPFVPETNGVPLVCDMSSNILTRKIDFSKVLYFMSICQQYYRDLDNKA